MGTKDPYMALIKTIKDDRVKADWWSEEDSPKWYILERHIAKQAWTDTRRNSLRWEAKSVIQGRKPAIISFFSFKGGVGRTSTLVATALTLARNGHRVAMVDLDLEAPGLATIFGIDSDNPDGGVIDYLLEYTIHGGSRSLPINTIADSILLGDNGQPLQLLSAGIIDNSYLEKLARLDFQNLVDGGLQATMQNILKKLQGPKEKEKSLDFILMDARAGFHDIGGLAISSLSHAAVIFGTQSRQSWAGLTQVIRHVALIKKKDDEPTNDDERLPLIFVHSMSPSIAMTGSQPELVEFGDKAYTVFQENYYFSEEDVPNQNDDQAPFFPYEIPYDQELRGDIALFLKSSSPEESRRLSNLVERLTNSNYRRIAQRLCDLFGRDFTKTN